jgi:uncharacterized protein (UPF0248 family)
MDAETKALTGAEIPDNFITHKLSDSLQHWLHAESRIAVHFASPHGLKAIQGQIEEVGRDYVQVDNNLIPFHAIAFVRQIRDGNNGQ